MSRQQAMSDDCAAGPSRRSLSRRPESGARAHPQRRERRARWRRSVRRNDGPPRPVVGACCRGRRSGSRRKMSRANERLAEAARRRRAMRAAREGPLRRCVPALEAEQADLARASSAPAAGAGHRSAAELGSAARRAVERSEPSSIGTLVKWGGRGTIPLDRAGGALDAMTRARPAACSAKRGPDPAAARAVHGCARPPRSRFPAGHRVHDLRVESPALQRQRSRRERRPLRRSAALPPARAGTRTCSPSIARRSSARPGSAWVTSTVAEPRAWTLAPITPEGILVVRGEDGSSAPSTTSPSPRRHPRRGALLQARQSPLPLPSLDLRARRRPPRRAGRAPGSIARARASCPCASRRGTACSSSTSTTSARPRRALAGAPPWLAALPARSGGSAAPRYEVRANWKLCVENFQESHCFRSMRPALEAITPFPGGPRPSSAKGRGWAGSWISSRPPRPSRRAAVPPPRSPVPRRGGRAANRVCDRTLFPGLLDSLRPDWLPPHYRLRPMRPDRTLADRRDLRAPRLPRRRASPM